MGDTTIQWTEKTWNPITGCTKVSQGCKNCYAERVFPRAYGKSRKFTDIQCHPERLDIPLHWKKPRRIFVNSMSDLFHEDVPEDFLRLVFITMLRAEHHTFQVLTKRPHRMQEYLSQFNGMLPWANLPNVWLCISAEDQETADERIPILLQTAAAVRGVSLEPLLGPIDLFRLNGGTLDALDGIDFEAIGDIRDADILSKTQHPPKLDWVIVGGESGPGARGSELSWYRDIIAQCKAAGVAVFVKQLGRYPCELHLKDKKGGDWDEWPEDLRIREYPK